MSAFQTYLFSPTAAPPAVCQAALANLDALYVRSPRGDYLPAPHEAIVAAGVKAAAAALRPGAPTFTGPASAREVLPALLGSRPYETFCVAFLDNRHRLIAFEEMFRGTVDRSAVYPREVAKAALSHNAAAVVLVHNHPSGVLEASSADELITKRLKEALAMFDIRVLDHFIVGADQVLSFSERGLL